MCLAIPGRVVEAANVGVNRIATVQFGGITRQIYLDFVPEAVPGDYILAHVGFAISIIDQAEAERTYSLLEEMGALAAEDEARR
jgi:hydrogenase expression/formation protein HypC